MGEGVKTPGSGYPAPGLCVRASQHFGMPPGQVSPEAAQAKMVPSVLNQLEWMAVAMKKQRDAAGPCP